jgi:hypothetical protein
MPFIADSAVGSQYFKVIKLSELVVFGKVTKAGTVTLPKKLRIRN